jgi:23S rRNA (cytidine1920-2'-O)/16S rRNA (cytidine1409-2'-O)-methyltransferase
MSNKVRVDQLLVQRGLVESRVLAQRLVMAGQVRAAGQIVLKASTLLDPGIHLEIAHAPPYVSRGGEKLAVALQTFPISVKGKRCADVGASTGGFTDCLLQHGAKQVYAIDVGQGILHWKLRQDRRVVVMEGTNARFVERLPEPVDLVTIDASFISLKILLPVIYAWFGESTGDVLALIKPQFEAGRGDARHGRGVIRNPQIHRQVLVDVLGYAQQIGYTANGLIRSPLLGPKGNVEFLAWLTFPTGKSLDFARLVDQAMIGQSPIDPQ